MDYTQPVVVDHGDLTDITAAQTDGDALDADFVSGVLRGDLTFS